MDTVKALEILECPQNIKFNILTFESWKNKIDRIHKLVEILKWEKTVLKHYNVELKIQHNNLLMKKLSTEETVKELIALNKLLPVFKNASVSLETAQEACTHAYMAGFAEGAKLAEVPQPNLEAEGEAISVVQQKIAEINAYVDANKLVLNGEISEIA